QTAHSGDKKRVPAGRYHVVATLNGYGDHKEDFEVTWGNTRQVILNLPPITTRKEDPDDKGGRGRQDEPRGRDMFEDPARIEERGGWLQIVSQTYAFLKPGSNSVVLTFNHPDKNKIAGIVPAGIKKMEWIVEFDDMNRVEYELNDKKLTVKPIIS